MHKFNTENGFLGVSVVNNPPESAGDWVRSLSQKDPLEKETATHFSILAWEIPRIQEPGGLHSTWWQDRHDLATEQQQNRE